MKKTVLIYEGKQFFSEKDVADKLREQGVDKDNELSDEFLINEAHSLGEIDYKEVDLELKHTKGVWEMQKLTFNGARKCPSIVCDNSPIALVWEGTLIESEANAKLMAAAPDLLEALQDVLLVFEEKEQAIPVSTQIKIEKAINKAI